MSNYHGGHTYLGTYATAGDEIDLLVHQVIFNMQNQAKERHTPLYYMNKQTNPQSHTSIVIDPSSMLVGHVTSLNF